jgi:cell wall-associated NlpC family hydrolase
LSEARNIPFHLLLNLKETFTATLARFTGVPYVFGGQTPEGLDCSGLVVQTFQSIGLPIADRKASELYEDLFTLSVPPDRGPVLEALFSRDTKGEIDHVAIVVGLDADCVFHTTSSVGFAHYASRDAAIPKNAERRFLDVFSLLEDTRWTQRTQTESQKTAEKSTTEN